MKLALKTANCKYLQFDSKILKLLISRPFSINLNHISSVCRRFTICKLSNGKLLHSEDIYN